jgi:hypothetical protein
MEEKDVVITPDDRRRLAAFAAIGFLRQLPIKIGVGPCAKIVEKEQNLEEVE